jgi:hypothetical protein
VKLVNAEADIDPETIRISVDTKATINIGPYSRGGRSRGLKAVKALDHDMMPKEKLEVRLIYYPPYHRKYNGIERYWGVLERPWNGYLLNSVETVLRRAGNFIWRRVRTTITLMEGMCEKGIEVSGKEKQNLERHLQRSEGLTWWGITIHP